MVNVINFAWIALAIYIGTPTIELEAKSNGGIGNIDYIMTPTRWIYL